MANENLKKMLALSKKLERTTSQNKQQITASKPSVSQRTLNKQVDELDEQVFGAYVPPQAQDGRKPYDAQDEMQHLQEMYSKGVDAPDLSNSKLPPSIIQSFMENPLTIDPSAYKDPKMEALTERISSKFKKEKNTGLSAVKSIQQKLDESDKSKSVVDKGQTTVSNIDYSIIKAIVESVLNEKIDSLKKQLINESNSHSSNSPSLKAMTIRNNKFLFLTNENEIYECNMVYKGKNTPKK